MIWEFHKSVLRQGFALADILKMPFVGGGGGRHYTDRYVVGGLRLSMSLEHKLATISQTEE